MARKVLVQLIDDLSGEEAQETVRFAIDGVQHEIDLTAAHAAELRNQLARYVAHGRRLPGGSARRSSKPAAGSRQPPAVKKTRRYVSGPKTADSTPANLTAVHIDLFVVGKSDDEQGIQK
jgi:hypothetical protein